jgi:hypothetical protein
MEMVADTVGMSIRRAFPSRRRMIAVSVAVTFPGPDDSLASEPEAAMTA